MVPNFCPQCGSFCKDNLKFVYKYDEGEPYIECQTCDFVFKVLVENEVRNSSLE